MQAHGRACRVHGFMPPGDQHSWRGTLAIQGAAGRTAQAVQREEEATARGMMCGPHGPGRKQALPLWKKSHTQRRQFNGVGCSPSASHKSMHRLMSAEMMPQQLSMFRFICGGGRRSLGS